jgi:cytidyltransferase-like protein
MSRSSVVILSGGFDPLHDGHLKMFKEAKERYDKVVVGINSDEWLSRKKGRPFMDCTTRYNVISALKYVDFVTTFDDEDNSAIALIRKVKNTYPNRTIVFGNGGDRSKGNFPEAVYCRVNRVAIDDTLGGFTKKNSSSDLLSKWDSSKDTASREWGSWRVLYNPSDTLKVKELYVDPWESLSWQNHEHRSEEWFVSEGTATLHLSNYYNKDIETRIIYANNTVHIAVGMWHKLSNRTDQPLSVVEIQHGSSCNELDIKRRPFPG